MRVHSVETIQTYYNDRVAGKLADFTDYNPRIEAAIVHLAEWAPPNPKRILEIGCGIGATSWRMARNWPGAEVIGADISPGSIDVANTCFKAPNLRYRAGLVEEGVFDGKFDLILLMDVYEHIDPADRETIHKTIRSLLSDESRLILTVPTPELLADGRAKDPSGIQPIDEDIDLDVIKRLSAETATDLLYYRQVGIWEYGDFAHLTFGRFERLAQVALREVHPKSGKKDALKRLLGIGRKPSSARRDYLATDVLRPSPRMVADGLQVMPDERRRLAKAWLSRQR